MYKQTREARYIRTSQIRTKTKQNQYIQTNEKESWYSRSTNTKENHDRQEIVKIYKQIRTGQDIQRDKQERIEIYKEIKKKVKSTHTRKKKSKAKCRSLSEKLTLKKFIWEKMSYK